MMKVLQIFSMIVILGVLPILGADYFSNNRFIEKFMQEQSIAIMGTILAVYFVAATSLLSIMMRHEEKVQKKNIFKNSTKELKHNIILVFCIFIFHFFVLVAIPTGLEGCVRIILKGIQIFSFLLYIYTLYELSNVLFSIRDTLNKDLEIK